jgi:hypothetical protein
MVARSLPLGKDQANPYPNPYQSVNRILFQFFKKQIIQLHNIIRSIDDENTVE